MFWVLKRSYNSKGTNGGLYDSHGNLICYTIELPWLNNQKQKSCIPEGTYTVQKRYSPKYKWHLHLTDVKDRSLILIHPANNAMLELKGCIAPVSVLTSWGTGLASRQAMKKLMERYEQSVKQNGSLFLTIVSFAE